MADNRTTDLLREFLGHEGIRNYDSALCWGCGEFKTDPCLPDCLLERTRIVIANPDNGDCWNCGQSLGCENCGH